MLTAIASGVARSFGTEPLAAGYEHDYFLDARDPDEAELTALELLQEMIEDNRKRVGRFEAKAIRNELYYHGDQFRDVNEHSLEVEDLDWLSDVPQVYRNYLRPLINTYSSRILEDRPDVRCYPNDAAHTDVLAVEVSNAILYHLAQRMQVDDLLWQASVIAQMHGKVYFWHPWDPDAGPKAPPQWDFDEQGNIVQVSRGAYQGEVSWEIATIFDIGTDGAQHIEDSDYVWRRTHITRQVARLLLLDAGIEEEPRTIHYTDVFEGEKEGTEVYEVWVRPCARIPAGCYYLVVGGHVVNYLDAYPYDHGELPCSEWKIDHRRNSPYGSTHVDDAVVIQRQINELVSVIQKLTRDCGNMIFVGHPSVVNTWASGNTRVPIANDRARKDNGWLDPPSPPPLLFAQLEELIRALYDVFGLNEILTGKENMRSGTSALQVEYLTKLDSMKLAGAARSLGKALRRAWGQTLALYQQFADDQRLEAITGAGSLHAVQAFRVADLAGVDVRLEPRSGIERFRSFAADQAEQEMLQGIIPPDQGLERRETGLPTTLASKWTMRVVQEQIRGALSGAGPQQPNPMVDPQAAVAEVEKAIQTAYGRLDDARMAPLYQLWQSYSQAAAQQQQAMMMQAQPQQGAPA